jgi:hypothetical protein
VTFSREFNVISELRKLSTIRGQCSKIFELAQKNGLKHFNLHEEKLDDVVGFVHELIKADYSSLKIPFHSRWRHFEAGGIQRHLKMQDQWGECDAMERARRHIDLVVVSVLLDAGAGPTWKFSESQSSSTFNRSEGLGVASFWMFANGEFSSDHAQPHRVDAEALENLKVQDLERGFQVTPENPLVGLQGRVELLQRLGRSLRNKPEFFASGGSFRPGNLIDAVVSCSPSAKEIRLSDLWQVVIEGLQEIWPSEGRMHWNGANLGDVWHHSALGNSNEPSAFVPFHKLSQWLTYSLLEPLSASGFDVSGIEELTGLPEYRNGGLFIDFEVLKPRDSQTLLIPQKVDAEWIVEWRALTVILLDHLAHRLRLKMGLSEAEFPLAKVLEGGTWKAGRKIAAQKRAGGPPPVQVISDGTVF